MGELAQLIEEVTKPGELRELVQHDFGNFVVQHIIEQDLEGKLQEMVVDELCRQDVTDTSINIHELIKLRGASKVVDQALTYCKPNLYARVVQALLKAKDGYSWKQQFSSFVLKNLRKSLVQILDGTGRFQERRDCVLKILLKDKELYEVAKSLGDLKLSDEALQSLKSQGVSVVEKRLGGRGECTAAANKRKGGKSRRKASTEVVQVMNSTASDAVPSGDWTSRDTKFCAICGIGIPNGIGMPNALCTYCGAVSR
jgi:hypothetical protein